MPGRCCWTNFPLVNSVHKRKKPKKEPLYERILRHGFDVVQMRCAWADQAGERKNLTGCRRYVVDIPSELQILSEILKRLMEKKLPFMAPTVAP